MEKGNHKVHMKQETRRVTTESQRKREKADEKSSMVKWNPAPDASPPSAPSESKTFTVSST
jgi:hypothetical protein